MQDAKEEVRARLAIEDVVGEYVQLKRAGRNFKGLSPFTSERTPSFIVSPEKQIWHDFSSGKGGDVFSFVMESEGLDFRQALEQLARRAGVDLSLYQSSHDGQITQKKQRLRELHDLAARYFQQSLIQNKHAIEYVFKKRSLTKQTVTDFQIGYAPTTKDALVQLLLARGFTESELKAAGLTNRFGGDLFRGRMTVPLMDSAGQVIGFTARLVDDQPNAPKYLNTPATLLYDKSRHVFGLSQAKEAIRTAGYTVIVEGNLDVVSSHQAGVKQVVATAGTAMTEYHLKALVRLSSQIRLAFDGDKAGLAATERAIPIAQTVGSELAIVSLPDGANDPDDLIRQDVKLWQQAIDTAVPAIDWILSQYEQREDITTAAGKRSYTNAGVALLKKLKDPVDQDHYLQLMARQTGASLDALKAKLSQQTGSTKIQSTRQVVAQPETQAPTGNELYQDNLLALLLTDSASRNQLKSVDSSVFIGQHRQDIADYLSTKSEIISDTPEALKKYDEYVRILTVIADERYSAWQGSDRTLEVGRLLRLMKKEHMKIKKNTLENKLREAEERQDDAGVRVIAEELNKIIKEIKYV